MSKANIICMNCPYYTFLYFDSQMKAIHECIHKKGFFIPFMVQIAENTGKCHYKPTNKQIENYAKRNNKLTNEQLKYILTSEQLNDIVLITSNFKLDWKRYYNLGFGKTKF